MSFKSLRLNKWFLILCKSSCCFLWKNLYNYQRRLKVALKAFMKQFPGHVHCSNTLTWVWLFCRISGWNNCGPRPLAAFSSTFLWTAPGHSLKSQNGLLLIRPHICLEWKKTACASWFQSFSHKPPPTFEVSRVYVMHLYYLQVIKYTIKFYNTNTSADNIVNNLYYYLFETIHS